MYICSLHFLLKTAFNWHINYCILTIWQRLSLWLFCASMWSCPWSYEPITYKVQFPYNFINWNIYFKVTNNTLKYTVHFIYAKIRSNRNFRSYWLVVWLNIFGFLQFSQVFIYSVVRFGLRTPPRTTLY